MQRLLILGVIYLFTGFLPLGTQIARNFEYEYALLASWAALFFIPITALVFPDKWLGITDNEFSPSKTLEAIWILIISPFIVPLIAIWYFSQQLCQCSNMGYVFWMALIWYPAWTSAHGLHHLFLRARCLGKNRWQLSASLLAIYLLMLVEVCCKLWFNPQKHITHQFAGFLHGPIYDTWIPVDNGLLWTRLSHFFAGGILLCAAWWRRATLNYCFTALIVLGWLTFGIFAQEYGSSSLGANALNHLLPGVRTHENFTLHYLPKPTASVNFQQSEKEIARLEAESQFHINEIAEIFKEAKLPHVEIYVYPSQDEKKLWFGGGATDVTDVHTPSLHITAGGNHTTLRHELVHALASEFGYFGLGFHPNMAFTEGLAVALAPEEDPISLDDGAAAVLESKGIDKVENLFSPFFWRESGERAYTIAGSFIRFLMDHYSIAGVKAKYSGSSWKKSFGKDQTELTAEWKMQIMEHFDRKTYGMYAEALFRNPGLFRAVCPHSRIDLRQTRVESPYVRLRQPVGWSPEDNYQAWIEKIDPSDLANRLSAWKGKITQIVNDSSKHETKLLTWAKVLNQARNFPPKTIEDADIAILESDVLRICGKTDEGNAILDEIRKFGNNTFLGDALTREIYARTKVEELGPTEAIKWRYYLAGWHPMPPGKISLGDSWFISYLKIRRLDAEPIALDLLNGFLNTKLDPELPKTVQIEWYRFLAYRFLRLASYSSAEAAWVRASELASGPKKESFNLYSREAAFFAKFSVR